MSNSRSNFVTLFESILIVFFIAIVVSNLFRFTAGRADTLNFEGLLNMLQNSSSMQSYAPLIDLQIRGSWGIFDFLRVFINSTTGLISFGLWWTENMVNCVVFCFSFIYQLFWI